MHDKPKQFNLNSWLNLIQLVILIGGGIYVTAQNNAKIDLAIKLLDEHRIKIDTLESQVSEMKGEMSRFVRSTSQ